MNPNVFALRRPFTVMVMDFAVTSGSGLAVHRMLIGIWRNLNLPVIYVAPPTGGMDLAQMEGLLTSYFEYHFRYVTGIGHIEPKNIQGIALLKLLFHTGTDMAQTVAETIG
jgi:multidrug efflux pump subunit AcrB